MEFLFHQTSALKCKSNNNSSDFITPNYIYGCAAQCQYCYMKRYNPTKAYVSTNINEIENSIREYAKTLDFPKFPNQQDPIFYMADIGCNTDIPLHQKYLKYAWYATNIDKTISINNSIGLFNILKFYDIHPKINSTFATKYSHMLTLDVTNFNKKPRVRISLMPEELSEIFEPNTTPIPERIKDIDRLYNLGWEVHLNFSPVIVIKRWLDLYKNLFQNIVNTSKTYNKCKSEVIFLTNHEFQMKFATNEKAKKIMSFAHEIKNNKGVMRYPIKDKRLYVEKFKILHKKELGTEIRYIF